jgi:hydroxymethylbilane synthase
MSSRNYILGTRSSPLAMWQAQFVQWLLEEQWPEDHFTILPIKTTGDDPKINLSKAGGKSLFIKELEEALINRQVDFCVHSMKDFPVVPAHGCALASVIERGEVRDVLISREKKTIKEFTSSMKIGTSSLRRKALLLSQKCSAELVDIRGNIDTRIQKMKDGEVDGIILAAAGVLRLGLENDITEYFEPKTFVPAPGQGAIAVECRSEDDDLRLKLRRIHHDESGQAVAAERAFLGALGGNCTLPLGAYCEIEQFQMKLHAFLADPSGSVVMMDRAIAPIGYGDQLGSQLADRLMHSGAKRILDLIGN